MSNDTDGPSLVPGDQHDGLGHAPDPELVGGTAATSPGRPVSLAVAVVGFAIPVFIYLAFIHKYGLNVVARDQWEDVGILEKAHLGRLGLGSLWAQWSVERIFFPRLLVLVLARTTGLNLVVEMYVSAVLLFGSAALFVAAHKRRSPATPLFHYVPVAVVLFSLTQYENTLWGFQVAWYLVLFAFAVVVFLLDRPSATWAAVAGSVLAATVASFSSFQGLLIWPVGLVLLYLRRRRPVYVWAWTAAAALAFFLYFDGFQRPANSLYGLHHPASSLRFFFFAVGDVLGVQVALIQRTTSPWVELFGVLLFACALWVVVTCGLHARKAAPESVGVALICFGLLWAASLTLSQSSGGIAAAAPSRFTLYSLLTPVGCYLAVLGRRPGPSFMAVRTATVAAIGILAVVGTVNGIEGGHSTYQARVREAIVTVNAARATPAQFVSVDSISFEHIQQGAIQERALHLSTYDDPPLLRSLQMLGLQSGLWGASLVQPVRPWRHVRVGQVVSVHGVGLPPSSVLYISECSPTIVATPSSLSIYLRFSQWSADPRFSTPHLASSCDPPIEVHSNGRGELNVRYRLTTGRRGAQKYLAIENAKRKAVVAAAELQFS